MPIPIQDQSYRVVAAGSAPDCPFVIYFYILWFIRSLVSILFQCIVIYLMYFISTFRLIFPFSYFFVCLFSFSFMLLLKYSVVDSSDVADFAVLFIICLPISLFFCRCVIFYLIYLLELFLILFIYLFTRFCLFILLLLSMLWMILSLYYLSILSGGFLLLLKDTVTAVFSWFVVPDLIVCFFLCFLIYVFIPLMCYAFASASDLSVVNGYFFWFIYFYTLIFLLFICLYVAADSYFSIESD